MPPDKAGRRLLAALAGSTPAFTHPATHEGHGRARRLLAALAGSTSAFTAYGASDRYIGSSLGQISALEAYADQFAALPPAERLAARIWLPESELAIIRALAVDPHAIRLLGHDAVLIGGRIYDHRPSLGVLRLIAGIARVHDMACDVADEFDRDPDYSSFIEARGLERILIEISTEVAVLAAADRDRNLAVDLARSLAYTRNRAGDLARTRDRDRARDLIRQLIRDLARDLTRASALDLVLRVRSREVMDLVRAVDQDAVRLGDLAGLRLSWVAAADRLLSATTDVVGADLARVNLEGVPLEGVRWSTQTRWPAGWATWARENSIKLGTGLYEIRPGRSDTNESISSTA